ncbi:DNA polymerase III subunit delta' [Alteraurantiacibacter palmitatis]|uniref:DNA polymerase III subunit delta n=1 Tax=Alteraurantiacibacter palmitatis TaxID=2054628 RepID=A0ABV7E724_9SPHN
MNLYGHEEAWREWNAALSGPRMHHGWILAGARGLGKASFAMQAARELVAEPGVPQPAGSHPDILVLSHLPATKEDEKKRDEGKPFQLKRNIAVEQIRGVQQRLHTRPTLGSRRAIIVDPADDLEKGAANALLKSLEEPPQGTYFLLVAHRPGRLLPTIRSRCRILRFARLNDAQMDAALREQAPEANASTRNAAIRASAGSPGAALEFLALDLAPVYELLDQIAKAGDPGFVLRGRLADAIGARPDRARQAAMLELARAITTSRMRDTPVRAIPLLCDTNAELANLAAQFPVANFDPGLLVQETGGLLARLAATRDAAHG